jgi:hypothetical protein
MSVPLISIPTAICPASFSHRISSREKEVTRVWTQGIEGQAEDI